MKTEKELQRIGSLIRTKRKERGLTQEQLAQALSCGKRTISAWENGTNFPYPNSIQPLCNVLGLLPTDFSTSVNCEETKKEASINLTDYLLQNFDTSFMNQHEIELFTKNISTKIENTYIDILTRKARKCKDAYLTGAYHNIYKCELLSHNEEYYTLENYIEADNAYYSCYKLDDDFNKIENIEYTIYPLIIRYKDKDYLIDWMIEKANNDDFPNFNMSELQLKKYRIFREKVTIK